MIGEAGDWPATPISPEPGRAEIKPDRARWPWGKIAGFAAAAAALVGVAVVATLAATQESAVRENEIAYLNGVWDGHVLSESGLFDDDEFDDD